MKKLLVLMFALISIGTCSQVYASEIGVRCDPVEYPHPVLYQFYSASTPAGNATTETTVLLNDVPGNCTTRAYHVVAIGQTPAGDLMSDPSTIVASIARPEIANINFDANGVHEIVGDNFPTDVTVAVNGALLTSGVDRAACQVVKIPTTPGTPTTIEVCNPDLATCALWTLPGPMAPLNMEAF